MRILGGSERVAIHSLMAASRSGFDVSFLSEEFDTNRVEEFFGCDGLFSRIRMLTYPEFKPLLGSGFTLYQRLFYHQAQSRKILSKAGRIDLVLGTKDVGYTPTVRAPTIQYCYFPEYFGHLEDAPSSPVWRLYYWPAHVFYRNRVHFIGQLLSTSNYTQRFIRKMWGRESSTLYPPCPVELYHKVSDHRENLAITVGRIVPSKRMNLFLEIARQLPAFNFAIVGSVPNANDSYYNLLRRSAPSNVSFFLSPLRRVKEILGKAKVYVHCTENEHFGITIVEAMAGGCVPVVHDSGGPRETVTPDVGFRWKDVDEAVRQVSAIMTDSQLQRELSKSSSEKAWLYSDEAFESSLMKILDDIRGRANYDSI